MNLQDGKVEMLNDLVENLKSSLQGVFSDSHLYGGEHKFDEYPHISALLPYRSYDSKKSLYHNKDNIGFIMELSPLVGATEETVKILSGLITHNLPDEVTLQFLNYASPAVNDILEKWKRERVKEGGIYNQLAEKRLEFFKDASWTSIFRRPYILRDFRNFLVVSISTENIRNEHDISVKEETLVDLRSRFSSTISSIGMNERDCNPDDFIKFIDLIINPRRTNKNSQKKWSKYDLLNNQISDGENLLKVDADGVEIGEDVRVNSFSIKQFPEYWAQWENTNLIGDLYSDDLRLDCPYIKSLSVKVAPDSNAKFKSVKATRDANSPIAKYQPEFEKIKRDWNFVVEHLDRGQKLTRCCYQIILFSKKENSGKSEQKLREIYQKNGWTIIKEKYVQLQTFIGALPFSLSSSLWREFERIGRTKTMVSWTTANLAPLQGEWKGMTSKPYLMLFGRRGQPLYWNPFENREGNYNVAVVGKSGSGKSVFLQELVTSIRGGGGRMFVIDDGRSFQNSCEMQGGKFLEFNAEKQICIDPFYMIDEKEFNRKDSDYKTDVLNLINQIIRQMCRSGIKTSDVENAYIEKAINKAWATKGKSATVTTVKDCLIAEAEHENDKRARDLGLMLTKYTKDGIYSHFFEGENNLSIENKLIVFELSELKNRKDLLAVVLMILMFLVSEAMYKSSRIDTTSLLIDEAWDLLYGEVMGSFIEGIARRARKYNSNLITGTQGIDDYYKNTAAKAAIENTDFICFMAQKDESIRQLKESSKVVMTSAMEENLKSLRMVDQEYSEVLIYGPSGYSVGRLILDPFSSALYSSKGADFAKVKQLRKQGLSLEEALQKVAVERM